MKGNSNTKDGVDPVKKSLINVRAQLYEAKFKIEELQEQVHEAEESAKDKSEDLSDAITKLRQYENGEYGLNEAVQEIQNIKKALKARDKQIDELMNQTNSIQFENSELQEENSDLRNKLGLGKKSQSSDRSVDHPNAKTSAHSQQDRALTQVLQREIERLEEERIQLKTENRKLAQQLGHRAAKLGLTNEDLTAIQEYTEALKNRRLGMTTIDGADPHHAIQMHEGSILVQRKLEEKINENLIMSKELGENKTKYEDLFDENNKLREGMHEILDSVKDQDGQSDVIVTSPVLEKLLTILDAKHFYGEYKPAMGLKTQIEKLEGVNSQLREQLRKLRLEGDKISNQNQRMKAKLQQTEAELTSIKEGNLFVDKQPQQIVSNSQNVPPINPPISIQISGDAAKLESQLIHVLDELDAKDRQNQTQERVLEEFNKKLSINKHQLGLLYEEHSNIISAKLEENSKQQMTIEELKQNYEGLTAKVEEYDSHLNSESTTDDDANKKVIETIRRIAILKSNEAILTRKYKVIEDKFLTSSNENTKLRDEILQLECQATKTIGELQRYKEMYIFKVESLEKAMEGSVPLSSLESANRQYNEITAKYRDILQKQQSQSVNARNIDELELQIQSFKTEKETLKKELIISKEKILSLESIVNSVGNTNSSSSQLLEVEKLAKQLATLEVKELNEKQKNDFINGQYTLLQAQIQQMEKRNTELEEKFDLVTKVNIDLQKIERDLRDELVTSIAREEFDTLHKKFKEVQESEVLVKLENNKLREIADISQTQILDFEKRKENNVIELEALRHQVLDLQSQTDEKTLIGRLHQQILSLQIKDNNFIQKNKFMDARLNSMETNTIKANKRSDEMEQYCLKMKNQYNIKMRSLFKIIQDLRRQYSGALPLSKQEKMSKNLISINEEKQKVSKLLRETESKLKEMEEKSYEMEIKKNGVDEILSTLKHNSGTKQVLDWHAKLESLRIKELHSRRNADHLEKEITMIKEVCNVQTSKAEQFEDEVVRLESLLEQKQLEWESKEIELEKNDLFTMKTSLDKEEGNSCDSSTTDLPLAKQLDSSLRKGRSLTKEIGELKTRLHNSKKAYEDLNKKYRDSDSLNIAKDKIINDLRSQLPTSVNRAVAMTAAIGQPGMPASITDNLDSSNNWEVAQSTINSLRERLKQKETTMTRYEELLEQSNTEHDESLKKRQEEIVILQTTIRSQQAAFNQLKSNRSNETSHSGAQIGQHISRIQELEDEVQELQISVGQLSTQLAEARKNNESLTHVSNIRFQEIEELKENQNIENQINLRQQKDQIEKLNCDIRAYKQENSMLKDDVARLESSNSKAPSVIMKSLVEKLRNDLAEKEKKQKAMSRVIAELRDEMVATAEQASASVAVNKSETEVQRLINRETKSFQTKISEQNILIDRLKKQIISFKDSEKKYNKEISALKERMEKKTSLLLKLKEEKITKARMSQSKSNKGSDDEKEDLQNKVDALEDKLRLMNTAEKPFEDDHESKTIKNAQEIAKWEEKKKWQKKFDEFKNRLKDADEEVSKLSKQNINLRETVTRLDREKMLLDQKWKSHLKTGGVKIPMDDGKVAALEQKIVELNSKLTSKSVGPPISEPGNETLKLKVKFLQGRVEQQEKRISILTVGKKEGSEGMVKEMENLKKREKILLKSNSKLEEDNVNLKIKIELIQHNITVARETVEKIEISSKKGILDNLPSPDATTMIENLKTILEKSIQNEKIPDVVSGTPIKLTKLKHDRKLSFDTQALQESLDTMKNSNKSLLETLEMKERKINELQIILRESKKKIGNPNSDKEKSGSEEDAMKSRQQMEIDLKRKSDLLSEVKVLLKQAADRERSQEKEKDQLKNQLKIITEIDPKSPSEALAKELRLCRLKCERLSCEKNELEHQISFLNNE